MRKKPKEATIFITSKTEMTIKDEHGYDKCKIDGMEGQLEVMLETGEWVRVRKLSKLIYPISLRVRFES